MARVSGRARLFTAYLVTIQVALSYLGLAVARRFRRPESIARLTLEKHRRNARRIEAGILKLRGLFIKVGQLISIMANVLPDAFREELQRLQDQVPPRPYADIEARLREEFGGRAPGEVFAEFSPEPVASASIGQVHRARLPSGETVAVKVQYPDIEEIVRVDLHALQRIFGVLRWFMPDYGFDTIYREIREMVLAELDYRREAAAIDKISGNFAKRAETAAHVRFPRVMAAYSTARVLTTEWMEGVEGRRPREAAGAERRPAGGRAPLRRGLLPADLHRRPVPRRSAPREPAGAKVGGRGRRSRHRVPGLRRDGTVSEQMRRGMMSFIQGAITRDSNRIVGGDEGHGVHLAPGRPRGVRPRGPVLPRQAARADVGRRASR